MVADPLRLPTVGILLFLAVVFEPILPVRVTPAGALHAQVVERERQGAVAPAAGIIEISSELRARLGLFPEVDRFRVARLFLRDDGTTVLEIESGSASEIIRERRILRADELESLRTELAARMEESGSRVVATREGRGGLVLGHTVLGLGYHGWAVPITLDVESSRSAVATYLLTAGASFYLPYRLTRDRAVTRSHRNLSLYGGSRGILAGLFIGDLLIGDDASRDSDSEPERVRFGVGSAVGTIGGVAGYMAAERWAPTEGTAGLWAALGDAGAAGGAALAYALGPYRTTETFTHFDDMVLIENRLRNRRLGHVMVLAGHGLGLAAGGWLGARRDYTTGDATALRSATVLGAQVGLTAARAMSDDGPLLAGLGVVGGAAGIAVGDRLLDGRSLEGGAGLLVAAGHLAGGAIALGTTYLLLDEETDRPLLYLVTSTVGSLAGAGLVWRSVAPEWGRVGAGPIRRGSLERVEVRLHPEAVFTGSLGGGAPPPLVTIRF